MKHLLHNVSFVFALLALASCAATAPSVATTAPAPADTTRKTPASLPAEDLSKYRPAFSGAKTESSAPVATAKPRPVPPTNQVNTQIDQRLRDQAYTNQNVKYAQGYRILAYVGLERDQAMAVRRTIIGQYPEETDYVTFKQPVYRLWVGDYLTRLEAEQAIQRIRPLAPKAELQPAQIVLNKTTY
ncbi:sporulation protein [Hymenobacter sp. GOD-10R]|uniref:sporulation protein n=1 Tax=Hymenobacter sp. GOD-10R TaxID=3093922 RepID=UPI002D79843B|nr:sporulation protein [Hymenobacter sp. GOD-10R]WRQ29456.1 sporulation protein [Hymenobacter sp. GOD-10R]